MQSSKYRRLVPGHPRAPSQPSVFDNITHRRMDTFFIGPVAAVQEISLLTSSFGSGVVTLVLFFIFLNLFFTFSIEKVLHWSKKTK